MYVSKLRLRNFRLFEDLEVAFEPGLNLLVGENNIGKTHIMDALHLVFGYGSASSLSANSPLCG
jgi:putative ATP-dependent endonuclease of OLD family